MAAQVKTGADLRTPPKYWDLEVRCAGLTFYAHRLIVCSKSPLFARQCETDAKAITIEEENCDALTMERMLLFMYTGSYAADLSTEPSSNAQVAKEKGQEPPAKPTPPHLRKRGLPSQDNASHLHFSRTNTLAAHLQLYVLADRYEVADLKALALKRFRVCGMGASTDVLEAVQTFGTACIDSTASSRTQLAGYAAVNRQLHLQLDRLVGDVADAQVEREAQIVSLRRDLEKAHKAKSRLVDETKKRVSSLEAQLANAVEEKMRLEQQLSDTSLRADKDTQALIVKETHRANELAESCRRQEAALKQETARANLNYDLCNKKDQLIKEKDAALDNQRIAYENEVFRANQARQLFGKAKYLSRSLSGCLNCGWAFHGLVQTSGGQCIIRCENCWMKHFERHVQ